MKMNISFIALFAFVTAGLFSGCHTTTYKNVSAPVELTDDQKYSLAYMWNEEKLAYDVYLELYKTFPLPQLYSIATNSESVHKARVEGLVETYDINITNLVDYTERYSKEELEALAAGEFAIGELQTAYTDLVSEGNVSKMASLGVGCKVEVKDIGDLTSYIALFDGIDDVVSTFEDLRTESYMHYDKFNAAIVGLGGGGCCDFGTEYCLAQ